MFHSTHNEIPPDVRIKIDNKVLSRANYVVKFLGLSLDDNLNWKYHINELSKKKLSRNCSILITIRNILPLNILIDIYNSLFMSFLQYGIAVWRLTFASYTDYIAKIQKKTIRTISHQPYLSHSLPIFKELKLLRVSDIFQLKLITFVYESMSNSNPSCFHEFFHFNSSVYSHKTRQSNRGDIISYHIISYHIISFHIISYHITSYHIISNHIISYHFISYHIISYQIISFYIISYHIISFHIISYHIISYHIISYHIISYHIIIYLLTQIKKWQPQDC